MKTIIKPEDFKEYRNKTIIASQQITGGESKSLEIMVHPFSNSKSYEIHVGNRKIRVFISFIEAIKFFNNL